MSRVPSILFVSQSRPELESLVTKVTGLAVSPSTPAAVGQWAIDCKYYTATVNIVIGSLTSVPTSKARTEAVIVLFDPKKEEGVGAFFAYVDQMASTKPDVAIAVCENFVDAVETYETVEAFCRDKGIELVELNPAPETVSTADSASARYESAEEYGPTRVLNALLSNPWSGMKRKKFTPKGAPAPEGEEEGEKKEGEKKPAESPAADKAEAEALVDACASKMKSAFREPVNSAGPVGEQSMGDLLGKLKQLKAKAANLSDEDRKKYAEKVALSFASATLGDDE